MAAHYQLQKISWTDADFDSMSWHDCPIRALSFTQDYQFMLDIDYIFEWRLTRSKKYYQFWIAPCTLIFKNVYNIAFESEHTTLIIDNISKENPQVPKNAAHIGRDTEFDWFIETTVGEISFKSVGYIQYVRQPPILLNAQEIDIRNRGGISFATSFSSQSEAPPLSQF